jgi:hypothetical protein
MSKWEERGINLDYGKNHGRITWHHKPGPGPIVTVSMLKFDEPGEQTETQSQNAIRAASVAALRELLGQIEDS